MATTVVTDGSNVTVAVLESKSTTTDLTPSTPSIAFLTVTGQSAHVMLGTSKVAVCSVSAA